MDGPDRKRARGSRRTGKQLANLILAKELAKFPRARYGKTFFERGTVDNINRWGADWKSATPQQRIDRKNYGYSGRGLYQGRGAYWGKSLGSLAGKFLGSRIGLGDLGGQLGGHLGDIGSDMIMKRLSGKGLYTGRGMYHHTNNLIEGGGGSVPDISGSGDETGSIVIHHKEYLTDVYAPGVSGGPAIPFTSVSYPLNPGLQSSFPFLSQIAQNYDEYEFIQLIFHYRSTTTDIGSSTNGQCGTVILCTNYNAAQPPFTDKQQMLEYAHAHDCKLTEHMSHGVECDPAKNAGSASLYTRSNPVVTNQDLKTYDKGLFQLAVANCPASYNGFPIGELWVEYRVSLKKPKLFSSRGLDIDGDIFVTPSVAIPGSPLATGQYPFAQGLNNATAQSQSPSIFVGQQNNIGCLVTANTLGDQLTILFPASFTGALKIRFTITPLVIVAGANIIGLASIAVQGNINVLNDMYQTGNPANLYRSEALAVGDPVGTPYAGEYHIYCRASTSGIDNKVTFTWGAGITSTVMSFLTIEQYYTQLTNSTSRLQFVNSSSGIVLNTV